MTWRFSNLSNSWVHVHDSWDPVHDIDTGSAIAFAEWVLCMQVHNAYLHCCLAWHNIGF